MKIDVEGHQLPLLKGAKKTLEKHKPSILIELDELHAPNRIQEATEIFTAYNYSGYFLQGKSLIPIAQFDRDRLHNMERAKKGHRRINDFLFFHKDRIVEINNRPGSFTIQEATH